MAGRDRDTYVHQRLGVTPETASIISQKNKIYAIPADAAAEGAAVQIGVVATFDPSETRAIEPVRGVGFGDHVAELVPGVTEPMTLAVTRTAQYLSMIFQVFGYKGGIDGLVRSLRHHKWPFDLVQEIVLSRLVTDPSVSNTISGNAAASDYIESFGGTGTFSPGAGLGALVTYYEGCWLSDYSTSYAADAALVTENTTVNVTDIVQSPEIDYGDMELNDSQLFNFMALSRIIPGLVGAENRTIAEI